MRPKVGLFRLSRSHVANVGDNAGMYAKGANDVMPCECMLNAIRYMLDMDAIGYVLRMYDGCREAMKDLIKHALESHQEQGSQDTSKTLLYPLV